MDPATAPVTLGFGSLDEVTRRHFRRTVHATSGLITLGAFLILAGHGLGIEALQTLGVGRAPAMAAAAGLYIALALGIVAAQEGRPGLARGMAGVVGAGALLVLAAHVVLPVGAREWLPYGGAVLVQGALAATLAAATAGGLRAQRIRAGGLVVALAVSVPALIAALHEWELADRLPPPLDLAGPTAAMAVLGCAALSALSPHRWPNRLFYRTPDDLPLLTRVVTLAFAAPLLLPILQRLGQTAGLPAEYAGLIAQLVAAGLLLGALVTVVQQRHRLSRRVEAQHREIEKAEREFRGLFEYAPIGMATVGLDGRLIRVNRSLSELLGRRARDLEGMSFVDLTHPEDVGTDVRLFEACLRGELDRYQIEKRYRRAGADWMVGELSVSVVRDRNGRPRHFVGQIVDRTRERAMESELRHAAQHDPLTGLANRRLLQERLTQELVAARDGGVVGVLVVDLDGFKAVNDQYGHEVGDLVLTVVSQRLVDVSRSFDTVARTGGDEFVICARLTDPRDLPELTDRIQRAVDQPLRLHGVAIDIAGTVGAVVGRAGDEIDELLRRADQQMYAVKRIRAAGGMGPASASHPADAMPG